jgi:hypothetical protein
MNSFDNFARPPSKDRFARLVADAVRRAGEAAEVRYDPGEFRLTAEGEGKQIFNLENAYREYCAAEPGQRRGLLRHFVRSWFAHHKGVPEKFEDVHPDLLPVVRGRRYYEVTRLQLRADGMDDPGCPYRTVAEHLAVGLGYDLPESIVQVRQANLDGWAVGFEQALAAACDNLRGLSRQPLEPAGPGVWRSPWRDNHDAARLMLTDLIRAHEVRGDPVAMVPNRDTLLLAGADDGAGLARLAGLAEQAAEHPRFLSGAAVRLRGDSWEPFLPAPDHPLHPRFRSLLVKSLARDYADQKEALDALNAKPGEDVFVASFSLLQQKGTGLIRSYCVWSEGVDSLLPRTDDVALCRVKGRDDGEVVGFFPWERLEAVAGGLRRRADLYPERYRVAGFPDGEQLAALRAGAAERQES